MVALGWPVSPGTWLGRMLALHSPVLLGACLDHMLALRCPLSRLQASFFVAYTAVAGVFQYFHSCSESVSLLSNL